MLPACRLTVFADNIQNPVMEAAARICRRHCLADRGKYLLIDPTSGIVRAAGPTSATAGMMATVERRLPGGNSIRLSYANGDALAMPALAHPVPLAQVLRRGSSAPRADLYDLRFPARWTDRNTVARELPLAAGRHGHQVAPFAVDAVEPYLNLHLRQPIFACATKARQASRRCST